MIDLRLKHRAEQCVHVGVVGDLVEHFHRFKAHVILHTNTSVIADALFCFLVRSFESQTYLAHQTSFKNAAQQQQQKQQKRSNNRGNRRVERAPLPAADRGGDAKRVGVDREHARTRQFVQPLQADLLQLRFELLCRDSLFARVQFAVLSRIVFE